MKPIHHKISAATMAAAITFAVPVVAKFEGEWLVAKPDRLAHGIPTVCFGETEGVKVGDRYTPQQCAEMLKNKLPRYFNEIATCIDAPISPMTLAAFGSFSYNIGTAGFCHSGTVRKFNAGDGPGACHAMLGWVYAGGQFRQGLLNRREKEEKMCMEGLL